MLLLQTAEMHEKDGTLFSMHDLVHDVARSVMVEEILYANEKSNNGASNCRYALLMECTKPFKFFANLPSRIKGATYPGLCPNCASWCFIFICQMLACLRFKQMLHTIVARFYWPIEAVKVP